MPVNLKCDNCGEKYYTATSKSYLAQKEECEKCGEKLKIVKTKKKNKPK